jgi:hypothetical protein
MKSKLSLLNTWINLKTFVISFGLLILVLFHGAPMVFGDRDMMVQITILVMFQIPSIEMVTKS